jgi:hypothetical protein
MPYQPYKRWLAGAALAVSCLALTVALRPLRAAESDGLSSAGTEAAAAVTATAQALGIAGTPAPLTADEEADAEAFRLRLKAWAQEMNAVYPYVAAFADPGVGKVLESLPGEIDSMAPEQLLAVEGIFTQHPAWWDFPEFLRALLSPDGAPMPLYYAKLMETWEEQGEIDYDTAVRLSARADAAAERELGREVQGPQLPKVTGRSQAGQPDAVQTPNPTQAVPLPTQEPFPTRGPLPDPQQPSRPGCPGVLEDQTCAKCPTYVPLAAAFAAKIVSIIAKGISDAIPKEVDIAIFPGVGVTLPNPVKPIFLAISQAAEAAVRALEFNNALADDCENGLHFALTDLYLDATVSSRVTQSSLDQQALLDMRLAIEENLLRPSDERISLFQLPQSVCGLAIPDDDPTTKSGFEGMRFCGQLEYVREIVDETIARNSAAGMTPELEHAQGELDSGDAHYMLSEWKSAYERYAAAYQYAVKQPATR